MFSGIVEQVASVESFALGQYPRRLSIRTKVALKDLEFGESIAIQGVCLSLVSYQDNRIDFDVVQETGRRSTLADLKTGDRVNLERSLRIGDRISGHFVFGHVDTTCKLLKRELDGQSYRLTFSLEKELSRAVVPKGSVSLAGVSLTVGEVESEHFSVYIIPHTAENTTLGGLQIGELVNCEIDMLMRYVQAQMQPGLINSGTHSSSV